MAWTDNALGLILSEGGKVWWQKTKFLCSPRTRNEIEQRLLHPESLPLPWTAARFYNLQDQDFAVMKQKLL